MPILYPVLSVIFVSLISFVGVLFLSFKTKQLKTILIYLVSFAAGAFFGDIFLHLIPGLIKSDSWNINTSLYVLLGIVLFLFTEKIIHWHHCHHIDCDDHAHPHPEPFAIMNLIGDGAHNFLDGLIIGASYLVSVPLGIATTLAVIFHEIPQEIGDFGVLIHGGYSKRKALFLNFLTATTAIIGTILALVLGKYVQDVVNILIPLAIGGFIYIAGSDLMPQIQKGENFKKILLEIVGFLLGIGVMAALLLLG